jgi:RNA polymerase sigma-70 factor (ECF subfamily)
MAKENDTRTLIARAQEGDREAFERLVSEDRARLHALVASRLGARLVLRLEFVYQETLLRAFQSLGRFEWQGEDSFRRWFGGIAENVILELARERARRREAPLRGDRTAGAVSASRAMRRDERFARLEDSLGKLSPEHREAILLVRVDGLGFEEAAERMGRSPDAVKQLLYRALKQLKATFGDTESLHLPGRALRREEDAEP